MDKTSHIQDRMSWWEYEHFLRGVDYTIIGGGIVGLSTAIELKTARPESKVAVIDKRSAPFGASTKNAGFACFGSISEIYDDCISFGEQTCRKLIRMRWEGLSIMMSRIGKEEMLYKPTPGAEIFTTKEEREFFEAKIDWANAFVADVVRDDQCYSKNNGRFGEEIVNKFEGSLNPQRMMASLENLARRMGVVFLNGIEVQGINMEEKSIEANVGNIKYNRLILCTNGFSKTLLPEEDIRPARNQVFVTNRLPGFDLDKCYHMHKGYVYFRSYDGRLLIGGGRHLDVKGETTEELSTTREIMDYLNEIVQNFILRGVEYKIEHSWSGILGVGETKMPMVKFVDDNVLIAVRMGGMGVAIGSFIGQVAASTILAKENRSYRLYVS